MAELAVIGEWFSIAAGGFYSGGESFFSGAVVDYAAHVQLFSNFPAEFAEAFSGPAFGAPAAARAEDDVVVDAGGGEIRRNPQTVVFGYLQLHGTYCGL